MNSPKVWCYVLPSVVLDEEGKIKLPRKVLDELGLRPGRALILEVKNGTIHLKPEVSPEEFISELRGCIKGSKIRPEELKRIWRM